MKYSSIDTNKLQEANGRGDKHTRRCTSRGEKMNWEKKKEEEEGRREK